LLVLLLLGVTAKVSIIFRQQAMMLNSSPQSCFDSEQTVGLNGAEFARIHI